MTWSQIIGVLLISTKELRMQHFFFPSFLNVPDHRKIRRVSTKFHAANVVPEDENLDITKA